MLRELEKLVEEEESSGGDPERMERELRQAALHLWRSQFVYESDWGSKTHYDLIRRHRAYFENLFDALGYRVVVGRAVDGYVGILAVELPPRQSMRLEDSLLLLVLRLYYEEAFKRYQITDAGEIEVDSETILQVYEERTRRQRPNVGRFQEILSQFKQRGLVRMSDEGDNRNFTLYLRPALPIVVGEDMLASLEEFVAKAGQAPEEAAS